MDVSSFLLSLCKAHWSIYPGGHEHSRNVCKGKWSGRVVEFQMLGKIE
jgi:hypothetical protein